MRRRTGSSSTAVAFIVGWALVASGQEGVVAQPHLPELPGSRIDQVTVDVVVLDRKGKPVTRLTKEDFTVREEGKEQTLANFQFIDRRPATRSEGLGGVARPRIASNAVPTTDPLHSRRTFVVLFDDLNLMPTNAHHAKAAVAAFLDRGVVEGDRVTLVATSGATWWSTRMNGGREDLMAILKRLSGRRIPETATERITDYEALQIAYFNDTLVAKRVLDRLERYGGRIAQTRSQETQEGREFYQRGVIEPFVAARAHEVYIKTRTRVNASLQAIERAMLSLSEGRDRKALVLVSEGFVYDPTLPKLKAVIEAARRSNSAIYFVDASGLRALDPMYAAEFGPALDSRDTMTAIADLSRDGEGAVALASDTGGFSIRGTNDFENDAARVGEESQAFYLLGYDPGDVPRDGRFRKIDVKVRGRYTVRARRGYFAPEPDGDTSAEPEKEGGPDKLLQATLDSPALASEIPLRMTAYALEDEALGKVRVVVAADVDISRVDFGEIDGQSRGTLDTILVVAHRDSGESDRTDKLVEIQLKPGVVAKEGAWYSFVREVVLPPGKFQAKLVVRDASSKRLGTVVHEFAVPSSDTLRVSSPILTDTLVDTSAGPVPAVLARRVFPSGGQLYCRFDVFGAGKGPGGLPKVEAGHLLRRADGSVVGRARPTLIEPTSLGALARMVQIPLAGLGAGEYELVLTVNDQVAGASQEVAEPFTVLPPSSGGR